MYYFLILGGNKYQSAEAFKLAYNALSLFGKILYKTKIYRTKPFGIKNQKFFYNQGIIYFSYLPFYLALNFFQTIEKKIGKKKKNNWGPRVIDIDIVYTYPLVKIKTKKLTLPHPQIYEREYAKIIFKELLEVFTKWQKENFQKKF